MADPDVERNEEATPFKLEKARGRGQAARSLDVVAAAVFTVAMLCLAARGWDALLAQFRAGLGLLALAGRGGDDALGLDRLAARALGDAAVALAPLFGAIVLAAILANVLQTGVMWTGHPLQPDLQRLDPLAGCKRLFSRRTLFDAARALLKLVLIAAVLWQALSTLLPAWLHTGGRSTAALGQAMVDDIAATGLRIAAVLWLVAALDWLFTRREFARTMRMSPREIREETKHREGDPRIRARMRQLRREALRRIAGLQRTAQADLVVTNPTHIAVALRYEAGSMAAPEVVAKGAGVMAAAIRGIAGRHRVPVVQHPPLARELYRLVQVDSPVPPALYAPLARLLVWVQAMRRARGQGMAQGQAA